MGDSVSSRRGSSRCVWVSLHSIWVPFLVVFYHFIECYTSHCCTHSHCESLVSSAFSTLLISLPSGRRLPFFTLQAGPALLNKKCLTVPDSNPVRSYPLLPVVFFQVNDNQAEDLARVALLLLLHPGCQSGTRVGPAAPLFLHLIEWMEREIIGIYIYLLSTAHFKYCISIGGPLKKENQPELSPTGR